MRPGPTIPAGAMDAQPAAPQDALALLHAPARALLQADRAPPVGGFQAARYFTYVFFALAISVVLVMIFLCTMHCYRRARRQRDFELQSTRQPISLPEVNIHIEPQRDQAPPSPKPLNVYDALLVRHPDGSKEVAYAPQLPPALVLQPELSAAQKALLRRSTRINSISRYEAGDSRARRRRQALEASLGRSRSLRQESYASGLPISTGDLMRGWSMEGAELLFATHRTASARDSGHRDGGARDSPERQRGASPSRASRSRRGSARRGSSGRRQQQQHDGGREDSTGMTVEQLAASETGRLQPFYTGRGHGGRSGSPPRSGQPTPQHARHSHRGVPGHSGLQLSSSSSDRDSGDEWAIQSSRQPPHSAGGVPGRAHRHARRHRSGGGSGANSGRR